MSRTLTPNFLPTQRQPREAIKRLVQFVNARNLGTGDMLPTQPELRKLLGFSNDTLTGAMRVLVDRGYLTRKKSVGTVLADRDALGRIGWTIGVGTIRADDEAGAPFYTELCLRVQMALADAGCRCRTYPRHARIDPPPLDDFIGLREDLAEDELDGVILLTSLSPAAWRSLRRRGLAVCHLPDFEDAPCGVVIDHGALAERGVEALRRRGCRRIAAVYPTKSIPGRARFWEAFGVALASAGLARRRGDEVITGWLSSAGIAEQASRIAQTLRDTRAADRPDGLIVADDHLASWLTRALVEVPGYRPHLVVQVARQQPLSYALPVIGLEIDIVELAALAARMVVGRTRNPALSDEVHWMAPRPVGGEVASAAGLIATF